MNVVVLHAYSADNAGDGLLVRETVELAREALGLGVSVTVLASHPETFADLDVTVLDSAPHLRGRNPDYLAALATLDRADLVLGVGGGYLRAGHLSEALKAALVHGPQLRAAARRGHGVIYFPQSIGPLGSRALADGPVGTALRRLVVSRLRSVAHVLVRDDRSLAEIGDACPRRFPDLALLTAGARTRADEPDTVAVLSVRAVRGDLPPLLPELRERLGRVDGYVQSTTGGNDDTEATSRLAFRAILTREALLDDTAGPRRVVVAVRLHAALMALNAGHLVVHLAYERKGFGAFDDLGLQRWVHPVFHFEPAAVAEQVRVLLSDEGARADYDARVAAARVRLAGRRTELVDLVRTAAGLAVGVRT